MKNKRDLTSAGYVKLFIASAILYGVAEFVLGSLFSLLLGSRYYAYHTLPLGDGFTSVFSPVLFAGIVLLLFDAFAPAYYGQKTPAGRMAFAGLVFAVLGPLYEWLSSVVIKMLFGASISTYYVFPILGGFTSLLAPAYYFLIGVAFAATCRKLGLLD